MFKVSRSLWLLVCAGAVLPGCSPKEENELSFPRLKVDAPKVDFQPKENENAIIEYNENISKLNHLGQEIYSEEN